MTFTTANMKNEINKGSIVKFTIPGSLHTGYRRVTARFKDSVNLGGIFNGKIYEKGVSLEGLEEAGEEWYAYWSKSETYMCM